MRGFIDGAIVVAVSMTLLAGCATPEEAAPAPAPTTAVEAQERYLSDMGKVSSLSGVGEERLIEIAVSVCDLDSLGADASSVLSDIRETYKLSPEAASAVYKAALSTVCLF